MGTVQFIQRTIDDIDNTADNRRGRVSYPIIKGFMETGFQVAEVDLTASGRKPEQLQLLLASYISTHKLPIKVLKRRSKLFLLRLDINEKGEPIPDWQEKLIEEKRALVGDVEEITAAVVDRE